jgi:hypothetical protein
MIAILIVVGSIAFAGAFAVAWWLRPALRRLIEAPKHGFADRVRQYDEACRASGARGAPTDAV